MGPDAHGQGLDVTGGSLPLSEPADRVELVVSNHPFRPLRHRSVRLLWTAAVVSDTGTWVQLIVVGSLVASNTGSLRSPACGRGPAAGGRFAGAGLIDRLPCR